MSSRFALAVACAALLVAIVQSASAQQSPGPKIDEEVLAELAATGSARTLVIARAAAKTGEAQPVSAATLSQGLTQILRSEAPIIRETGVPGVLTAGLTRKTIDALAARPEVVAIRPNRSYGPIIETPSASPSAVAAGQGHSPAAASPRFADELIQVDRLQGYGWLGEGVTIAVIDSGLDATHPMFADALAGEACFSEQAPDQGVTSLCKDRKERIVGAGAASFCLPDDPDDCVHGTHVAGIALGRPINDGGRMISGVAPKARLLMIKAMSKICRKGDGKTECGKQFSSATLMAALQHILDNADAMKIRVVNMSLGGQAFWFACDAKDPDMTGMIRKLAAKGITVVAASGNEKKMAGVGHPACISGVVAIGSIDQDGQVSSYSNAAFKVDLLAPGRDILSAKRGGGFVALDGTSMATPYAAGVIAALYATLPAGVPATTVSDALKRTGRYIRDPRNDLYFPVIQAERALEALLGQKRANAGPGAATASQPAPAAAAPAAQPEPPRPAPAPAVARQPSLNDMLRSTAPQ